MKQSAALDFDDLLMQTVQLLKNNAKVRSRYQERYLHLLVDEFQDTNLVQYELISCSAASTAISASSATPTSRFTPGARRIYATS